MADIAVIGAGISGLHLALRLQQAGVSTTVYTDRAPEQMASGRPTTLTLRWHNTRERERALGVEHWERSDLDVYGINVNIEDEPPLRFFGRLEAPGTGVDFRVYLPALLQDYVDRGGKVEVTEFDIPTIDRLASRHDLVVVATGRRTFADLFARVPERSPYTSAPRRLFGGLFRGIAPSDPSGIHLQLIPGAGEIFSVRQLSLDDELVHGMVVEAEPGGPLEPLTNASLAADRAKLRTTLLDTLAQYAPLLRERIDEKEFNLTRPDDFLQGGLVPVVRESWATLPSGGHALALGDAWVLNDPLAGQGANLGSRCAFALTELVLEDKPFDDTFRDRVARRMWELAEPVVQWSNQAVGPPADGMVEILGAAGADPRVGDAFVANFDHPEAQWDALRSLDSTRTWIEDVKGLQRTR